MEYQNQYNKQLQRIKNGSGFIAALDQSGGSTPKALANYGVTGDDLTADTNLNGNFKHLTGDIVLESFCNFSCL